MRGGSRGPSSGSRPEWPQGEALYDAVHMSDEDPDAVMSLHTPWTTVLESAEGLQRKLTDERMHSEQLRLLGSAIHVSAEGIAILTPAVEAVGLAHRVRQRRLLRDVWPPARRHHRTDPADLRHRRAPSLDSRVAAATRLRAPSLRGGGDGAAGRRRGVRARPAARADRRRRPAHALVAFLRDVTVTKHQVSTLRHQAMHDALTGLPNRTLLFEVLEKAIETARSGGSMLALLLMDLDRFKEVNDTLILAQQLFENHDENLTEKQIRYAKTIHSCGNDLIRLVNDILDLSKIESGVISVDIMPVDFREIVSFVETNFRSISETKNLSFKIEIDENLPDKLDTDIQRLAQILKNLLSNAFKFTEKGEVKLSINCPSLDQRSHVAGDSFIVFSIEDTGIGIPEKKQSLIFEAFRQAEGSTSRKYGGTGLGLSISKGFAELLGGAILVDSRAG